jgi:Malectin domain
MQSAIGKLEAERVELDALLTSGELGRANNIVRLLTFVCEKYFEGAEDEIKEYSIAVQALGRPDSFDPQVDTIVRVTAHALRKRLEEYYRSAGTNHSVQICLPSGHYVPKFIHKTAEELEGNRHLPDHSNGSQAVNELLSKEKDSSDESSRNVVPPSTESAVELDPKWRKGVEYARDLKSRLGLVKAAAIVVLSLGVLTLLAWYRWNGPGKKGDGSKTLAAAAPVSSSVRALHALAGNNLPYTDRGGFTWEGDHFCSGGSPFSVAGHTIQGTEDQQLFSSGRRGVFHCKYPVPPGAYEVHLLFAETSGLQENSGNFGFSVNGGPVFNLDVVDDAGGNDMATTKVLADVAPENDGEIHLDFSSPEAFLNAVEILPTTAHHMLPVRIVTGHSAYIDSHGNVWIPDRYFFGGRLSSFSGDLSGVQDGRLYEWHRFGHFHYVLPVAPGGKYTLKLYFEEHWFGVQNGGIGGAGSRVFDVSCNGLMLLKDFDIFREAGSQPIVKSFPHIEPTPQGKIEIYFTPNINYPSVSAVEVIPE